MTTEILREAAAKMRERAKAVGAAPWFANEEIAELPASTMASTYVRHSIWGTDSRSRSNTPYIAEANGMTSAEHIASWHPNVALAVADWLDNCANRWQYGPFSPEKSHATNIARVYLGKAGA